MIDTLRVILEVGQKRRVVAGAMDWPGLDRWGTSEEDALAKLASYVPRYAGVAERAGLADEFARARSMDVVERVPGSSSTDYWGIAHVPSEIEREVLSATDLERRLDLLRACWSSFDDTAARVSAELRLGPRGGGWSRDDIVRHVYKNEPEQFSRKVEVRTPREVVLTAEGLAAHRRAYLDAIRAWNAAGRPARTWPIQFLIRRTAHHVMDHAWELEDRDPGSPPDRAGWLAARRRSSAERFDVRFAAIYDDHWGTVFPSHLAMIDRLLERCPPRPDMLDAACGTGRYWPQILPRVGALHGTDHSAGMLRRAAEKFPDVPTEVQALTDVTARDAYDAITCIDAMEYVPAEEWPIVLTAFRRALRPGGHLYFTVEQADPAELDAEYRRALDAGHPVVPGEAVMGDEPDEEGGYHYYPSRAQVEAWLEGTGFEIADQMTGDEYWHVLARRA